MGREADKVVALTGSKNCGQNLAKIFLGLHELGIAAEFGFSLYDSGVSSKARGTPRAETQGGSVFKLGY